jgi:hypothetical protein
MLRQFSIDDSYFEFNFPLIKLSALIEFFFVFHTFVILLGCDPQHNQCLTCPTSCLFCQNPMRGPDCQENDCLKCRAGYIFHPFYDDGTGSCLTPRELPHYYKLFFCRYIYTSGKPNILSWFMREIFC